MNTVPRHDETTHEHRLWRPPFCSAAIPRGPAHPPMGARAGDDLLVEDLAARRARLRRHLPPAPAAETAPAAPVLSAELLELLADIGTKRRAPTDDLELIADGAA